jgi:uncharacterized protein
MKKKKLPPRPLVVVTGGSTGIGYELAHCCADKGYDLVVAADEPEIETAAENFRSFGCAVESVQADLATIQGSAVLFTAKPLCPDCPSYPLANREVHSSFLCGLKTL